MAHIEFGKIICTFTLYSCPSDEGFKQYLDEEHKDRIAMMVATKAAEHPVSV